MRDVAMPSLNEQISRSAPAYLLQDDDQEMVDLATLDSMQAVPQQEGQAPGTKGMPSLLERRYRQYDEPLLYPLARLSKLLHQY